MFVPLPEIEIDVLQRRFREPFPGMDLDRLQQVHLKKCESYHK